MRIALPTCSNLPEWEEDDRPLHAALAERGVDVERPVWDDAGIDWSRYRACLIRTTWDYQEKREAFVAWARRVAELIAHDRAAGVCTGFPYTSLRLAPITPADMSVPEPESRVVPLDRPFRNEREPVTYEPRRTARHDVTQDAFLDIDAVPGERRGHARFLLDDDGRVAEWNAGHNVPNFFSPPGVDLGTAWAFSVFGSYGNDADDLDKCLQELSGVFAAETREWELEFGKKAVASAT